MARIVHFEIHAVDPQALIAFYTDVSRTPAPPDSPWTSRALEKWLFADDAGAADAPRR